MELGIAMVRRQVLEELQEEGAVGAFSLEELVGQLQGPRSVWMMLPAAIVDGTLEKLLPLLQSGDTVILASVLFERFSSRGEGDFADRVLSAMRFQFGCHLEKKGGA